MEKKPMLKWSNEFPYHMARFGKREHYSIECIDGPVRYFELKGTKIYPTRKFLTCSDAKEYAQKHYEDVL